MGYIKDRQSKKSVPIRRIAIVSIVVASLLIAFFATTNAVISLSASTTDSFTTTVNGIATNAVDTPITLNGHSFTSTNIVGYTAAATGCLSTVSISASNFVPNDYVQFSVKITNTGTETLAFQPFTYTIGYPSPTTSTSKPWTLTNFGTDTLSTYLTHLAGSRSTNWLMDFSYTATATLPTTLASGATFTYNLYVGLGSNAPYGTPECYFSSNIPLSSVTPTPTPKPTPCPTPTPKPTSTPK